MSIRVLLADDQTILRKGMRSLFERQPGYTIVGEARDGAETIAMTERLAPDVILMDITMPVLNGIEATRRITSAGLATKILILSVHSDIRFIEKAFGAGASGYVRKDCDFEEVLHAITAIISGNHYVSRALIPGSHLGGIERPPGTHVPQDLTPREMQVLRRIAEGSTTKEIASELYLSVKSIERYRQTIMEKLNLHSIADLTKYAVSEGLIPLD